MLLSTVLTIRSHGHNSGGAKFSVGGGLHDALNGEHHVNILLLNHTGSHYRVFTQHSVSDAREIHIS